MTPPRLKIEPGASASKSGFIELYLRPWQPRPGTGWAMQRETEQLNPRRQDSSGVETHDHVDRKHIWDFPTRHHSVRLRRKGHCWGMWAKIFRWLIHPNWQGFIEFLKSPRLGISENTVAVSPWEISSDIRQATLFKIKVCWVYPVNIPAGVGRGGAQEKGVWFPEEENTLFINYQKQNCVCQNKLCQEI